METSAEKEVFAHLDQWEQALCMHDLFTDEYWRKRTENLVLHASLESKPQDRPSQSGELFV